MQKNLNQNIAYIKNKFGKTDSLIFKNIDIHNKPACIVYMVGLNDAKNISELVISPLIDLQESFDSLDTLSKKIYLSETTIQFDDETLISSILKGKAILLVDGHEDYLILAVEKYKERTLTEPPTSAVLKGPRSGFVENILTNIAVLRKILATPDLKDIKLTVGKHTQTAVSIVYIDGIANTEVVDIVKKRIDGINIDGIIDSFYISQYLEEHPNSMFKQVGNSEKPDVIASKLLEGRVAILVDGSPLVLTVPFLYIEDIQSGDDYYSNHARASVVRWIRIASIFITMLAPALYIAIILHHYKAIPLKFLVTIVNTTRGLPLTPFAEILFVLVLFEILYEASLRMPKYLGLALSIVGALILGDTAVKAGLISPPAVMIVAISGLAIYCVPDQAPQLYILRTVFTFAGAMLGFFGITALLLFLLAYLCDFDSYNTPYFAPIAPLVKKDLNDALYKTDITHIKTRPFSINNNKKNMKRQGKKK